MHHISQSILIPLTQLTQTQVRPFPAHTADSFAAISSLNPTCTKSSLHMSRKANKVIVTASNEPLIWVTPVPLSSSLGRVLPTAIRATPTRPCSLP